MTINIGTSEVRKLIADMGNVPSQVAADVLRSTRRGAWQVKQDAQKRASGLAHAPHYPRAITYDVRVAANAIIAEIGPDKSKPQGPLGNILEFGTVNNPPHPHLAPALDKETPKYIAALEAVLGGVLDG